MKQHFDAFFVTAVVRKKRYNVNLKKNEYIIILEEMILFYNRSLTNQSNKYLKYAKKNIKDLNEKKLIIREFKNQ